MMFHKIFHKNAVRRYRTREQMLKKTQKRKDQQNRLTALVVAIVFLLVVGYTQGVTASGLTETISNAVKRALPIYCVQTEEKKIALTFDAAWGDEDTEEIMSILEQHNVHVTFFMTGGWVDSYPDDVKMIYSKGHELGNHSENHKNMSQLSSDEIEAELQSVHDKVKELTGYEMKVFRPPYGDYDDEVVTTVNDMGYACIQWDVDSLDWKDYGVDSIIQTVCEHKHLSNGSIILMHNGAKYTAQALDTLLTNLEEQGYQFVTVSELIYSENYTIDNEGRQIPEEQAQKDL
jgi:polysaccharide deacetylase family sporulation protein PdaB